MEKFEKHERPESDRTVDVAEEVATGVGRLGDASKFFEKVRRDNLRDARSRDAGRRESAAFGLSSSTSEEKSALSKLSHDKELSVRLAVAGNTSASLADFKWLSRKGENVDVRVAVVNTLSRIVDPDYLDLLVELFDDEELKFKFRKDVKIVLASYLGAGDDVLRELSHDRLWEVRRMAANNPMTPESSLLFLAMDEIEDVAMVVARRSEISGDVLDALILNNNPDVVEAAVGRYDIPLAKLAQFSVDERNDVLRAAVAMRDDLSPAFLLEFAKNEARLVEEGKGGEDAWAVRFLLVQHKNSSKDIWKMFANDENPKVVEAVKKRMA